MTSDELEALCREQETEQAKAWAREQVTKRMEALREDVKKAFSCWMVLSIASGSEAAMEAKRRTTEALDWIEKELIKAAEREAG